MNNAVETSNSTLNDIVENHRIVINDLIRVISILSSDVTKETNMIIKEELIDIKRRLNHD